MIMVNFGCVDDVVAAKEIHSLLNHIGVHLKMVAPRVVLELYVAALGLRGGVAYRTRGCMSLVLFFRVASRQRDGRPSKSGDSAMVWLKTKPRLATKPLRRRALFLASHRRSCRRHLM